MRKIVIGSVVAGCLALAGVAQAQSNPLGGATTQTSPLRLEGVFVNTGAYFEPVATGRVVNPLPVPVTARVVLTFYDAANHVIGSQGETVQLAANDDHSFTLHWSGPERLTADRLEGTRAAVSVEQVQ